MRAYLAGGGVSLPYTLEFFNEKLSLPIEFFNPLRRIGAATGVDPSTLSADAHCLGECVGLALRGTSDQCPLQVALPAPSLEAAEANRKRQPFLAAAAAALVAALAIAGFYFDRAASRVAGLNAEAAALAQPLQQFKDQLDRLTGERRRLLEDAADLAAAPLLRTAWADVINEINNKLPARNIWLTKLRPMVGEQVLEPGDAGAAWVLPEFPKDDEGNAAAITALVLDGLYLENEGGPAVVDAFVESLAASPAFAITEENKAGVIQLRATQSGEAWAYDYKLILPLARPIPL